MSYGAGLYWIGYTPSIQPFDSPIGLTTIRKYKLTMEFNGHGTKECVFEVDNELPSTDITKIIRDEWNKVSNNGDVQASRLSSTPHRVSFDGEVSSMKIIRIIPSSPTFEKPIQFGCCEEIEIGLHAFNAY